MRTLKASLISDLGNAGKLARRYMVSTALTATGILALSSPALADNWTDHAGDGITVDTSTPNTTNITQTLDTVKIHGDGDINAGWTVNVAQPSSSSKYVLYDVEADPTYIMGNLNANGQIYIFDQNGVIFGKDSIVNVGSIIASTGHISDANLAANKYVFEGVGTDGKIELNGKITVADQGLAAFVAPSVVNNGEIIAHTGTVVLAAGEKVTIDLYGDDLVNIAADDKLENALVANKGNIIAHGGKVVLSAQAAGDAVNNVINMDGVIDVSSVTVKGGKIVLNGGNKGTVKVAGKLDASGKNGGGSVNVKGQNINAEESSLFVADAHGNGNGGTVDIIAQDHTDFRGSVFARGGENGGNGGFSEISGYGALGFSGYADLSAIKGTAGSLLLDPTWAVIHSGVLNNPLGLGYVLSAQALADAMRNGTLVTVQADEFIDVGTRNTAYNTGDAFVDGILNALIGTGNIDLSTWKDTVYGGLFSGCFFGCPISGTTISDIKFQSDTVNFNKDLKMGDGDVIVDANTINLGARLFDKNGTTLLGDSRLIGTSAVATVNVRSNAASINQGINFADDETALTTVNVGNGTYNENVLINKSNLKLQSVNGHASTTIDGDSSRPGQGTVEIASGVHDVRVGDTNKGFHILGFDGPTNDERAAVYLTGTHDAITIKGNHITADGDEALLTQYGQANSNITIDSNIIDGKTYTGPSGAWGTGDQFVVPNVPRQLVAMGPGLSDVVFTNNEITGDAGDRQLVAINSSGATISGNTFDGLTTAAMLRVRGSDINVFDNTLDGNNVAATGIEVDNVTGVTIGGADDSFKNTIKDIASGWNHSGINIAGGSDITVSHNDLGNIGGQGIYAEGPYAGPVTTLDITDNTITDTEHNAIYIKKWNGANIEDNTIDGTTFGHGVQLELTNNTDVVGNTISNAVGAGINLYYGNDTTKIQTNTLTDNKIGVRLENADNTNTTIGSNLVPALGNTITGGTTGILVNGGENLMIGSNTISGSSDAGIDVKDSGGFNIVYFNKVNATGNDGIRVQNTAGVSLFDNRVGQLSAIGGNGISITASDNAQLLANQINNTRKNGINLSLSNAAVIDENLIGLLGGAQNIQGDGIYLNKSNNATISKNKIKDTKSPSSDIGSGVQLVSSNGATVTGNTMTNMAWDGIRVFKSNNVTATGNDIDNAGHSGIYGQSSHNLTLTGNHIDTIGNNAIWVGYSNDLLVQGNFIGLNGNIGTDLSGSGRNGILVGNGHSIRILDNEIANTAMNGIRVDSLSLGAGDTYSAEITGNVINKTGKNGVDVSKSGNVLVSLNEIGLTGNDDNILGDGIHVEQSAFATISGNQIKDVKSVADVTPAGIATGSGIQLVSSNNALVTGNTIEDMGWDGVRVFKSNNVTVTNNYIDDAFKSGIYGEASDNLTLTGNHIDTIGNNGIWVGFADTLLIENNFIGLNGNIGTNNLATRGNGIRVDSGSDAQILNNHIANTQEDGIHVERVSKAAAAHAVTITGNDTTDTGGDGIEVLRNKETLITSNIITNAAQVGILGSGANNGAITVSLNTVTNADIGMKFESGIIDLTGPGNTIAGGRVGLMFSTLNANNLFLIDNDGAGSTPYAPNTIPANFAGTIGNQTFTGQSESYVELAGAAFWDTINNVPLWINGLNSTYDAFVPPADGILTQAEYDLVEGKFRDYFDGINTGIFFFGAVPDDIDESKFLRDFPGFNGDITGLNIRILGLPRVGGESVAQALGVDLNGITPFAGGSNNPADLNNISTAAGGTDGQSQAQNVADIEPAAGDENTSCWGDALAFAGNGQAVNVVYSGSMADTMATASTCSTGSL